MLEIRRISPAPRLPPFVLSCVLLVQVVDKRTLTTKLERGFFSGCEDLQPSRKVVVYPGGERFPRANDVDAISLSDLVMLIASGEHLGEA